MVPGARRPGSSVCLAAPGVRRATLQPCLHVLLACPPLLLHRLLEPAGPPRPEASPEHSASEGLSGMSRQPAPPPRSGRTPPGPWSRTRVGRAPLNGAPPGLGAGKLEAGGLLISTSLSCPSACVSVCLGRPCGWSLDTDLGTREPRFLGEASPSHPAGQPVLPAAPGGGGLLA